MYILRFIYLTYEAKNIAEYARAVAFPFQEVSLRYEVISVFFES